MKAQDLGQLTELIIFLAIGVLAGWIASAAMRGKGYGVLGNALVGIAGSFFGWFLFNLIGIAPEGRFGSMITAIVGAVLLLFVAGKFKK